MTKSEALVCLSLHIYIFSFSLVLIFYLHLLYFLTCFLFYSFIVSFALVFPLSLFSLSLADVQTPWWTNWSAYINVSLSFFLSLLQSLSLCNAHTKQLRDRKAGHSRQAPSHTHAKAWLACTCAEWQKEKDTDTRLCMQVYSKCDLHCKDRKLNSHTKMGWTSRGASDGANVNRDINHSVHARNYRSKQKQHVSHE